MFDITLKKKPPPETTPSPGELVGMFFKWADPSNSDSGSQFYHISKV